MPSNAGSFPLKLSQFFVTNSSYWKAQQLASQTAIALSEQNTQWSIVFQKHLYWNKQLTTLFVMQEALYFFLIIHFYIMIQGQSNFTQAFSAVIMRVYSFLIISIESTTQMQLCSWLLASNLQVHACMIKQFFCCTSNICWMFNKLSHIFSAPRLKKQKVIVM